MSLLRNIKHDLLEKRLWPVALALLIAAVAAPILLSSGGHDAPADVAAISTTPAAPAHPAGTVISVEEPGNDPVHRGGKVRNPFIQHHVPKPPKPETAPTPSTSLVNALKNAAGGGGTTNFPRPAPVAKPKPVTPITYTVGLKFGKGDTHKTYADVARLTPLPSPSDPVVVFLGVSADGESAVFLVSSDAVASGDGTCKPSVADCETVELKKGDTEFFDLGTGTADAVQYQLEVTGVKGSATTAKAAAVQAHAAESHDGRAVLRAVMATDPQVMANWQFSPQRGVLIESPDASPGDVAHLPAGLADAADGDAPDGIPVATVRVAAQPR